MLSGVGRACSREYADAARTAAPSLASRTTSPHRSRPVRRFWLVALPRYGTLEGTSFERPSMTSTVTPGQLIAQGKYRVERVLGEGGMGVVVGATHVGFDDRVAIKLLRPELAQNAELVQRFLREGRASRKIRNEHVVQVMDVGTLESGAPYLVMEYLEGEDLAQRLARTGPLPPAEAVELLLQACEAIAEAHVIGIVHRDLKPANLFSVARRGGAPCIKVLDFGISKLTEGAGPSNAALTRTTATMGSPLYMSPEQLHSSRHVDARSDVWALGVILYELLTGTLPFAGDDLPRLTVQIVLHAPIPIQTYRADLPPALVAAVSRCLEKDPAHRFANVAELARALEPVCSDRARMSVERIVSIASSSGAISVPVASRSPSLPDALRSAPAWTPPSLSPASSSPAAATPAGLAPSVASAVPVSTTGAMMTSSAGAPRASGGPGRGSKVLLAAGGVALLLVIAAAGLLGARSKTPADGNANAPVVAAPLPPPTAPASAARPPPPPAPPTASARDVDPPAPPSASALPAPAPVVKAAPAARPAPAVPRAKGIETTRQGSSIVPTPQPPPKPKPASTVDDTL